MPDRFFGTGLPDAVRFLSTKTSPPPVEQGTSPIFLLSAGWRSGSTLVQRLITSDPSVLMWGEPFGDHALVQHLSKVIEPFAPDSPHLKYSVDSFEGEYSNEWIANLNPGVMALRSAHRRYFDTLFAEPADVRGHRRWGCKWVRLTADHAYCLKWLYPDARFVFLVRHPLHAYASYRGNRWFLIRPSIRVTTLRQFLAHWTRLAGSFLAEHEELGARIVRYEDVIGEPRTVTSLSEFLGVNIDREVLERRVGARKRPRRYPIAGQFLPLVTAREVCRRLGYRLSGKVLPWCPGSSS